MSKELPATWIPATSSLVAKEDEIPLLFKPKNPSTDELLKFLKSRTDKIEALKVSDLRWKEGSTLLEGIGESSWISEIALSPLEGSLYFVMPSQDIKSLLGAMLGIESNVVPEDVEKGFYDYFIVDLLAFLESTKLFQDLSPRLVSSKSKIDHALALTLDFTLQLKDKSLLARVVIPPVLRKNWNRHLETKQLIAPHLDKDAPLAVSVGAGSVTVSLDEWSHAKPGDFIVLDSSGFEPQKKEGRVFLSYEHHILFHGSLIGNKIKISEQKDVQT